MLITFPFIIRIEQIDERDNRIDRRRDYLVVLTLYGGQWSVLFSFPIILGISELCNQKT